jgi:hypothetical protein
MTHSKKDAFAKKIPERKAKTMACLAKLPKKSVSRKKRASLKNSVPSKKRVSRHMKTMREDYEDRKWALMGCFKRIEFEGTVERVRGKCTVFEEKMWKEVEWKRYLQPRVVR